MIDYHLHTKFSPDSNAEMEDVVLAGIASRLSEMAFTDHIDFTFNESFDPIAYQAEFFRLKEKYKDSVHLTLGVEIGLSPGCNDRNAAFAELKDYPSLAPFEFIIGSSHDITSLDLYTQDFFKGKTKREAYEIYFKEIISNIKTFPYFDVYGHLDYIIRYGTYGDNSLRYADYADYFDTVFRLLIERGKGIELNTSGFRYGFGTTHPSKEIAKRYFELGGEIVTTGSDAHSPDYVAAHFDYVQAMLDEFGVKYVCRFRNRKPEFIKLN